MIPVDNDKVPDPGTSATSPSPSTSDSTGSPRSKRRLPVRVVALAVVASSLGAMALVDRFVERSTRRRAVVNSGALGPVATDPTSSLSTWFCAGGSLAEGNDDLVITIANPTDTVSKGSVTFYGGAGEREDVQVEVPARSVITKSARSSITAGHVAALVELDRGGIAVDHRIEQGGLYSISPCSSSAGTSWFLADGSTELGSSAELSLFNPFGEDAIVDLSFATDQGPAKPAALQGFVVPRNSVASIDIGSYVRRRTVVSTSLQARVGRLVVEHIQRTEGEPGRLALATASPSLGSSWFFPNGRTTQRLKERYVLYNPTDTDVTAQVDFLIDGAESEPFDLEIPKLSQTELIPSDESRIPIDVGYSVVVATVEPGIVVSRTLVANSTLRSGMAITLGGRRIANRWLVPDALATKKRDDRLAFLNPTDTDAAVTVSLISNGTTTAIEGLVRVSLPSGGRLALRVGDYTTVEEGGSLLVESQGAPVIVERSASGVTAVGERTERPTLVTVDANTVFPSPDADAGVDEGDPVDSSLAAMRNRRSPPTGVGGRTISFAVQVPALVVGGRAQSSAVTATSVPASTVPVASGPVVTATSVPEVVTTTTRLSVPLVAVARPTRASGSTSSAMAIPLDGG